MELPFYKYHLLTVHGDTAIIYATGFTIKGGGILFTGGKHDSSHCGWAQVEHIKLIARGVRVYPDTPLDSVEVK